LEQHGVDAVPKRILVVEDEFLIALDIAGTLEQGGHVVVGPFASRKVATAALKTEKIDGALLDANLGGEPVGDIADLLAARRLPFAFVSGYGTDQLPAHHRHVPLVRKPFTGSDLLAVVERF
jgi:CheY-like chemotaxis protein